MKICFLPLKTLFYQPGLDERFSNQDKHENWPQLSFQWTLNAPEWSSYSLSIPWQMKCCHWVWFPFFQIFSRSWFCVRHWMCPLVWIQQFPLVWVPSPWTSLVHLLRSSSSSSSSFTSVLYGFRASLLSRSLRFSSSTDSCHTLAAISRQKLNPKLPR